MANEPTVLLENVKITLKNFAGVPDKFNPNGYRTFAVLLDDEIAEEMARDGWLIKQFKQKDPGEPPQSFIKVRVRFGSKIPRVVMITSRGRTTLTDEEDLKLLDWADIRVVDLILRPHDWEMDGKTGRKAYLKSMFATIEEDALERKYADVPEAGEDD
jgi:hypothetical protein